MFVGEGIVVSIVGCVGKEKCWLSCFLDSSSFPGDVARSSAVLVCPSCSRH